MALPIVRLLEPVERGVRLTAQHRSATYLVRSGEYIPWEPGHDTVYLPWCRRGRQEVLVEDVFRRVALQLPGMRLYGVFEDDIGALIVYSSMGRVLPISKRQHE